MRRKVSCRASSPSTRRTPGLWPAPALRYRIRRVVYEVDEIDPDSGAISQREGSCGVVDWLGEMVGDGRELARSALVPRIEREDDPKHWLRDYLTDRGPSPSAEVKVAAKERGFGERALQRAAGSDRRRHDPGRIPAAYDLAASQSRHLP